MNFLKKWFYPISISSLLITMFLLMFFSAKGDSVIVDEIAHIPSGYSYITTGDYRLNPEHPPLIKDLAALPLTLFNLEFPFSLWESNNPVVNNQWEMGWSFLFKMGNNPDFIKLVAEIPIMLLSVLFGFFVYKWAKELFGEKAGLFALILFVFNVNIIAHSRFVTTDLGISFAFFVSTYTVYKFIKKPNLKNIIIAGLAFGLVLVTKFSAAVLAPTYLLIWLLLIFKKGNESNKNILEQVNDKKWTKRALSSFLGFAIIVFIGILTMWLYYIPHTINMPSQVQKDLITESQVGPFTAPLQIMSDNALTKPLAQWLLGFAMVTAHVEGGHDAYLLGMTSNQGWWYYYPVVIALKTQIPIFILLILTFVLWKKLDKKDWFTETYFWVLPAVLLAMGMQGKLCLGIRYMLPIYAYIFVFVSPLANLITLDNLKKTSKNLREFSIAWFIVLMMGWYMLSGLFTYPHYLSYFNEFIGGYKNGYKYLTDSNIDWGQDIKRLNQWTIDNNVDQIYVDVFPGSYDPEILYYMGDKAIEWHVQNGRPNGYFAVSATFYQNSKLKKGANGGVDYSFLDSIEPVDNIGGSILIYKL